MGSWARARATGLDERLVPLWPPLRPAGRLGFSDKMAEGFEKDGSGDGMMIGHLCFGEVPG